MNTAKRISVTQLKDALSKGPAGQRLGGDLVIDWTIMGRILRERGLKLDEAEKLATEMAHESAAAFKSHGGGALEPAVLIAHGRVVCGFLPPRDLSISFE